MRKFIQISALLLVLWPHSLKATHIVGGEFELIHLEGTQYLVNLILYFDVVSGNPDAFDPSISARIFRIRDGAFMDNVFMPAITREEVLYSIQECAIGELVTDRIFYSTLISLSPQLYDDPLGYRIVWERCCRNQGIVNIQDPLETGQKFYLDFSPVVKDGADLINSSPVLFPPLSDYACIDQFYFADFAGDDPDGDSLVYSLATPLNSSTDQVIPIPTPQLSPTVTWANNFNLDRVILGDPVLQIDKSGLVTVKPSFTGLFVFSVKVEEFRDGEKIGEVRRDFQMLVIDCPPPGIPPKVLARPPNENEFKPQIETIKYARGDDKCVELIVIDGEENENIRLIAKPVNFTGDVSDIISINQGFLTGAEDTLKVEICFPDCPYIKDGLFIIDLLAFDDTCPQGLIDTLRFEIDMEAPFNQEPFFTNSTKLVTKTIRIRIFSFLMLLE